jgi:acyl carrier protein
MGNTISDTDIFTGIVAIVASALRVKPEQIVPSSRLFKDLNAESLDIVDIRFQIEHTFGFKIDQGEIYQALGRELTADELHEKLTVVSIVDFVKYRLAQGTTVP